MKKSLLLLTPFVLGLAQTAPAGDLLAWWNFDTPATGKSVDVQSGYIGQLLNGAQYTTPGTGRSGAGADRGMLFGNDRHRMYVPDATFLNAAGAVNTVSVSFWQNLGELRSQYTFYAAVPGIPQAFSAHTPWEPDVNDAVPQAIYWDTGGCCDAATQRIQVDSSIILSVWHHIVLTKNGDTKRIYVNGAELINGPNTAPIPTTFTDMFIGNHPNATNAVSGVIDDFAVFRRELTPAEVTTLFAGASPGSLEANNDTDTDGLPDQWERRFAVDLTVLAAGVDTDADGLLNEAELALGTNPNNPDTDADGAPDGSETSTGVWVSLANRGTSPFIADTDKDGLLDGVESNSGIVAGPSDTGSNPHLSDTDNDGAPDAFEITKGTNPSNPNSTPLLWTVRNAISGGGLGSIASVNNLFGPSGSINAQTTTSETVINFRENANGPFQPQAAFPAIGTQETDTNGFAIKATGRISVTSPGLYTFGFSSDDGGGIYIDGVPVVVFDADRGTGTSLGVVNLAVGSHKVEFLFWENVGGAQVQLFVANTLGDFTASGTDDATILANYHLLETSVFDTTDSDSDGLPDIYETSLFPGDLTKLGLGDFDGDTINDPAEYTNGTNPTRADTDNDGLTDSQEVLAGTNPVNPDTDLDGLPDGAETKTGIFVNFLNTGTDPLKLDSDGDKWSDGVEVGWPSDPNIKASQPSVTPGKLDLLAFWDFDDNSNVKLSRDRIHGFPATFLGGTVYTPAGQGAHGTPTDRAMDMGTAGGVNGANVADAGWFGLGVPAPYFNNVGSLGSDGDLLQGRSNPGTPGVLVGSSNTGITTAAPNGATFVPYNAGLNPSGSFTAEAWLKPAAAMNPGQLLCAISSGVFSNPRTGWLVYQSDSGWNLRTYYNDGLATSVNITGNNGAAPVPGVWTHLVITWDSVTGQAKIYVDGQERRQSDPGKAYVPGTAAGRFSVGSRSDNTFHWNGDVDEVAFYGSALDASVVAAHYANGLAPAPAPTYDALVQQSNPLGYWRMTLSSLDPRAPDQVAVTFWQKQMAAGNSSSFWAHSPSSNNGERGFQAHVPWSDGNIYFDTAGCCDPPQRLVVAGAVNIGEWNHYVFQKDGGHKEIWKDGTKLMEGDGFDFLLRDFYKLYIGSADNGGNAQRGMIDDFAVFGDPLTPAQIVLLASGASPPSLLPFEIEFTQFRPNTPGLNQVSLTWTSRPGRTYVLEVSQSLTAPSWLELDDNIPSAGNFTSYIHNLLNTYPTGTSRVFYRVRENL